MTMIEALLNHDPKRVALKSSELSLNYAQLLDAVETLNDTFRVVLPKEKTCVVLHLPNCVSYVETLLALVKLEYPFTSVPLETPLSRLEFILKDVGTSILVTTTTELNSGKLASLEPKKISIVTKEQLTDLDEDIVMVQVKVDLSPSVVPLHSECCYIMYTSGSTGDPKGVQCLKSSVLNMADGQMKIFQLSPNDVTAQFSSIGFDAVISEVFTTFLSGGTLAVLYSTERLGEELPATVEALGVTVITLPATLLEIYKRDDFPTLRKLITAGEACTKRVADLWVQTGTLKFFNAYGAAETTVCDLVYEHLPNVDGEVDMQGNNAGDGLPIGKAIQNVKVCLLDADMNEVDAGQVGEIYVGGKGLSLGYIGHAAGLTIERFVVNPNNTGERLYRTGDLAVRLASGDLVFEGRVDEQIKMRGQMVNLQGIEQKIRNCEGVTHATVVDVQLVQGSHCLAAFVSPKWMSKDFLKDYLSSYLLCHEIPTYIEMVDVADLPRNASGKIDKKALGKDSSLLHLKVSESGTQALTEMQRRVAKAWLGVIGAAEDTMSQFSSQTTVTEVGITSNKIGPLQRALNNEFGIKIKAVQLVKLQTLEAQANYFQQQLPPSQ